MPEPVEREQTGVVSDSQPEQVSEQEQAEAFYDASKVPQDLQPSFREMQAAWTQKTQELAKQREQWEHLGQYGSPEEVAQFMQTLSDPEGLVNWWYNVAVELGLNDQELNALVSRSLGQETAPASSAPAGGVQSDLPSSQGVGQHEDAPPPWFRQYLASQDMAQRAAREDAEVEEALRSVGVRDKTEERAILGIAQGIPAHLGYKERIKRAKDEYDKVLSSAGSGRRESKVPADISAGAAALSVEKEPETLEEARKQAQAYIDKLVTSE